jgi:hypothetical protein
VIRASAGRAGVVALAALAAATAAVWGGALLFLRPARGTPPARPPIAPTPLVEEEGQAAVLPVFAVSDGVALHLLSGDAVAVAFHEAAYHDATALRPLGRCVLCGNRRKFSPPPPQVPGLVYVVTDTRGRDTPATSAADVVVEQGAQIVAPVTGVVTDVERYRLYGRYRDVQVEIRPRGVPDRRVVLLHLERVRVARGDLVEASVTPIGVVRRLPFESQVDRYVRGRYPHVHMEVKDPAARRTPKKS